MPWKSKLNKLSSPRFGGVGGFLFWVFFFSPMIFITAIESKLRYHFVVRILVS
jgi:hypothetical protein